MERRKKEEESKSYRNQEPEGKNGEKGSQQKRENEREVKENRNVVE